MSGGATGAHRHEKYPVKPFHACKDSHFPIFLLPLQPKKESEHIILYYNEEDTDSFDADGRYVSPGRRCDEEREGRHLCR